MRELFPSGVPCYRGNLHTHTSLSDGRKTPEDTVAAYRARGYSFIAVTDHRRTYPTVTTDDFTVLSGIELDFNDYDERKAWHVIGIGMTELCEVVSETPQKMAEAIRKAGGIAVLGHPHWSLLEASDLRDTPCCPFSEIYSGVSEGYTGRGNSAQIFDAAAAHGTFKLLLGVDDVHFHDRDFAKAWVKVFAKSIAPGELLAALKRGDFYASEGPDFEQVVIDGDTVTVTCSPVSRICFYSDLFYSADRVAIGDKITTATYKIKDKDTWLRIELTDEEGCHATTQYIKLDKPVK